MLSRLCQLATRRKDALSTCSRVPSMILEQTNTDATHYLAQQPALQGLCTQSEGYFIHHQRGIATLIAHDHWPSQRGEGMQTIAYRSSMNRMPAQTANNQIVETRRLIPKQCSVWDGIMQQQQVRFAGQLSRVRVPKSAAIDDRIMPNTTDLKYGSYGIRALTGKRVAANTIEAMRSRVMQKCEGRGRTVSCRTDSDLLMGADHTNVMDGNYVEMTVLDNELKALQGLTLKRRLKKTAALWIRIAATVPVTRKPQGIRMGKGKGAIDFYACAVRPGQIIAEMDRVPRPIALSALAAVQPKFPCKLAFVEWS